jgi:hypothetical protein
VPMGAQTSAARPGRTSSTVALISGLLAPSLAAGGAFLAHGGALPSYSGFRLFLLGIPFAAVALLFATFASFRGRSGRNRAAVLKAGLAGALAVLTIAAVVGVAAPGAGYPLINDITTDTADPPRFVAALRARPGAGDMAYPPAFAEEQKRAYPGVVTRTMAIPPEQAFDDVRGALEGMQNIRVVDASKSEGRIEAVAVSRVFRFVDDVVVRIRPSADGGSRIDIRSRSRDGKGDLGVNAQRIDNLLTILR